MDTMISGDKVETVAKESATYRTQFNQEKTSASMAVIATLADVLDADPVEMEPLHSTVDPDALDAIVRVRPEMDGDTHVTFTHERHEITVSSYGVVTITGERESIAEIVEATREDNV